MNEKNKQSQFGGPVNNDSDCVRFVSWLSFFMRFIRHTYTELDWIWLLFGRRNFIHFFFGSVLLHIQKQTSWFQCSHKFPRVRQSKIAIQWSIDNDLLCMICVWAPTKARIYKPKKLINGK